MTKFIGITLDIIALTLVTVGIYFGIESLLLFPYVLFWFSSIVILIFLFASKEFCLKDYKPRSKTWQVYDFISDNVFVTLCFYLNWTALGVFMLIMIILKAVKYEGLDRELKRKLV